MSWFIVYQLPSGKLKSTGCTSKTDLNVIMGFLHRRKIDFTVEELTV